LVLTLTKQRAERRSKRGAKPATGAVLYARVSTQQQRDSGVGKEAQLAKCREHAERLGLPILSVHTDEGMSGQDGIEARPGLWAAIEAVQRHRGSVLIAYSLSRLARRQRLVWHILDDREGLGIPFSSATEAFDTASSMGRAMLGMLATWAQLESDLASERTRDALDAVRDRGTKLGAPNMVESTDEEGNRFIDPAKARIVRRVQSLYATGKYSHRTLADYLNDKGVPTTSGDGQWWPKTVRTALHITWT